MPGPMHSMKGPPLSPSAVRGRLLWAAGIAVATVAAFVLAGWHGRESRALFRAPPGLGQRPAAAVGSAADAFVVWRGSGLRGRRLLLLTGQFGGSSRLQGATATGGAVTPASAVYWASRLGLVRAIDVVLPPADFERQRAGDAAHKEFQPEAGAYRHDLHGFWLRFSSPDAVLPPTEPALVLVEPSWFRPGAPADPLAWLSSLGIRTDLALVALDDPNATDSDRRAAASYARGAGIPQLEIERTP
jgi:hypothetical protein